MFNQHNVLTILLLSVVLINSIFAVFYGQNVVSGLLNFSSWKETLYWLVSGGAIVGSILGGIFVLRKKRVGVSICLWVYAIQVFGLITESYNYVISVGFNVSFSTDLEILFNLVGKSIEFNLVALTIVVISGFTLLSLNKTQGEQTCT